VIELSAIGNA